LVRREEVNEKLRAALQLSQLIAPTGKEQQAFVLMLSEMNMDGCDPDEQLEWLLSAMLDGLRHGNWPKPDHADRSDDCGQVECAPEGV
jgi:hypothetical protein